MYKYTDKCREISGFGGEYEAVCKAMVIAGLEWLDNHPEAKPNEWKTIFDEKEDLRAICQVMNDKANEMKFGATGAMMGTCLSHVRFVSKQGWESYIAQMEM